MLRNVSVINNIIHDANFILIFLFPYQLNFSLKNYHTAPQCVVYFEKYELIP